MFYDIAAFPILSLPIAMLGLKLRLVDYDSNMSKYIFMSRQKQIEV